MATRGRCHLNMNMKSWTKCTRSVLKMFVFRVFKKERENIIRYIFTGFYFHSQRWLLVISSKILFWSSFSEKKSLTTCLHMNISLTVPQYSYTWLQRIIAPVVSVMFNISTSSLTNQVCFLSVWWTALNTTIPMSLCCCCYGEEAGQRSESEPNPSPWLLNSSKTDPESEKWADLNCWVICQVSVKCTL